MRKYLGHISLIFLIVFLGTVHYVNSSSMPEKQKLEVEIPFFNTNEDGGDFAANNDTPVDTIYSYFDMISRRRFSESIDDISLRQITEEEKIATQEYTKNIKTIEIMDLYFFDGESIKNGNPDMAGISVQYKIYYKDIPEELVNTSNYLIVRKEGKWYLKDDEFDWDESRLMLAVNKDKDIQELIQKSMHSYEYFEEKNPDYFK